MSLYKSLVFPRKPVAAPTKELTTEGKKRKKLSWLDKSWNEVISGKKSKDDSEENSDSKED